MKTNALDNEQYIDEINENNIGIVPEDPKQKRKRYILIILILIVFLGLLFSMIYFFKTGSIIFSNKMYADQNLFVVHSNNSFGDNLISLNSYDSYNKAYSYTFFVQNGNDKQVNYKLTMIDSDFGKKGTIDKSKVSYAILRNSKMVFKGKLADKEKNVLVGERIFANQKDNYELKLWLENNTSGYLKFKIIISK